MASGDTCRVDSNVDLGGHPRALSLRPDGFGHPSHSPPETPRRGTGVSVTSAGRRVLAPGGEVEDVTEGTLRWQWGGSGLGLEGCARLRVHGWRVGSGRTSAEGGWTGERTPWELGKRDPWMYGDGHQSSKTGPLDHGGLHETLGVVVTSPGEGRPGRDEPTSGLGGGREGCVGHEKVPRTPRVK